MLVLRHRRTGAGEGLFCVVRCRDRAGFCYFVVGLGFCFFVGIFARSARDVAIQVGFDAQSNEPSLW